MTTDPRIRDKVAEELCEADETIGHKPWAECSEYERDTYRLSAGIAIAAYREADKEAQAQEDGYRMGIGAAVATLDMVARKQPENAPLLSGIALALRQASAAYRTEPS